MISFPFFPVLWTSLVLFLVFRCRLFLPTVATCWSYRELFPVFLSYTVSSSWALQFSSVISLSLPQLWVFALAGFCVFSGFLCAFSWSSTGSAALSSTSFVFLSCPVHFSSPRVFCSGCYSVSATCRVSFAVSALFPL